MRAARNVNFSDGLLFSAILIQTADVKTLAGNGHWLSSDWFPSTHWSVVLAAGRSQAEPEIAQAALAELVPNLLGAALQFRAQSRAIPCTMRKISTQSFFAYLIERKIYARADRQKGRFRSFLLASLKIFSRTLSTANGR